MLRWELNLWLRTQKESVQTSRPPWSLALLDILMVGSFTFKRVETKYILDITVHSWLYISCYCLISWTNSINYLCGSQVGNKTNDKKCIMGGAADVILCPLKYMRWNEPKWSQESVVFKGVVVRSLCFLFKQQNREEMRVHGEKGLCAL